MVDSSGAIRESSGLAPSVSANNGAAARPPKHTSAGRLFGYDIFISFALGPAPRGAQALRISRPQ